jgi:hypothetical protein
VSVGERGGDASERGGGETLPLGQAGGIRRQGQGCAPPPLYTCVHLELAAYTLHARGLVSRWQLTPPDPIHPAQFYAPRLPPGEEAAWYTALTAVSLAAGLSPHRFMHAGPNCLAAVQPHV